MGYRSAAARRQPWERLHRRACMRALVLQVRIDQRHMRERAPWINEPRLLRGLHRPLDARRGIAPDAQPPEARLAIVGAFRPATLDVDRASLTGWGVLALRLGIVLSRGSPPSPLSAALSRACNMSA